MKKLTSDGTQNKTRTCTPLRVLVPETSASTNFATWAFYAFLCHVCHLNILILKKSFAKLIDKYDYTTKKMKVYYLSVITNSVRLFNALPTTVVFGATGFFIPNPLEVIRDVVIPFSLR